MSGTGKMVWPDGNTYVGEYALDLKDGFGEFTWPDGKWFRGNWSQGKQNGSGV
jgi:hypothetical protein